MADLKISQLNSLAGGSLANNDELAIVDTSASETKKITSKDLVQYGYGLVDASTLDGDVIEPGTTSARGTVQLTDSTSSTSTTTAATPNAVKGAYDLANAALPKSGGTMTGQILADDSTSASTPGYAFDGDPNTGLLRAGADELALVTGGSARLTIDASGNVVVPGNFTVSGTTTTIDTTTLIVEDKNIEMGVVGTPTDVTADGGGITLKGTTDKTINWVDATNAWTSSERFSYPIGSAASPALTFTGDEDTGIYSPTANEIAFSTAGTGRLFISASGTIGVNTSTSLLHPLNIQSDSGAGSIMIRGRAADNKSTLLFVNSGAAANIGQIQADADGISIGTGSTPTERFRADAAGQLQAGSLGTAAAPVWSFSADKNTGIYSPGADQVAISTNGTGRLFVDASGNVSLSSTTALISTNTVDTSDNKRLILTGGGAIGVERGAYINLQGNEYSGGGNAAIVAGDNGYINFSTGSGTERLRITSDGKLGLGTSVPGKKLEISSSSQYDGWRLSNGSQTVAELVGLSATNDNGSLNLRSSGSTNVEIRASGNSYFNGGNVGIGTTSPGETLDVNGPIKSRARGTIQGSSTAGVTLSYDDSNSLARLETWASKPISIETAGSERLRIDTSGRLLVGTSTATNNVNSFTQPKLAVVTTGDGNFGGASLTSYVGTTSPTNRSSGLDFQRSRGTTDGSLTKVEPDDRIGVIRFKGADGTAFIDGAFIAAAVDGATGTNDMPTRLTFSTTADGASSPTERLRIGNNGNVQFTTGSSVYPLTDNSIELGGGASYRWSQVWAANGTIQTSDRRTKTVITDAQLGSEFVKSLRPVSYKWIEGGKRQTDQVGADGLPLYESVPGERTHWGFIAQEVKQAVDAAGVDFGGWVLTDKDDPDSKQALRYDQFIAPLTKALQETMAELEALKAEVAALKGA